MPTMRGWHASTIFAPAACKRLGDEPGETLVVADAGDSATLPERSIGIMGTSENDAARGLFLSACRFIESGRLLQHKPISHFLMRL